MRLNVENRLPQKYDAATLALLLRDFARQLNQLSEGFIVANTNASASMPSSGTYANGDFVKKTTLAEAGGAGTKYVIIGWLRLTNGSNHVLNTDWVTARVLTGN